MNKIIFTFLLLLYFSQNTFAQKFTTKLSEKLEYEESNIDIDDIYGTDGKSLYIYGSKKRKDGFMKMNTDFKISNYIEFDIKDIMKKGEGIGTKFYNDRITTFLEYKNKKEDRIINYEYSLDLNSFKYGEVNEIMNIQQNLSSRSGSNGSDNRAILVNESKTRTAVLASLPGESRKDKNSAKTVLHMFDENFKLLYKTDIETPENYDRYSVNNAIVGEDGSYITIGSAYDVVDPNKRKEKVAEGSVKIVLIKFGPKGKEVETILSAKDKTLLNSKFLTFKNGDILCMSLYSKPDMKKNRMGPVEGISYIKIDGKTGDVVKEKYTEFDTKLLSRMTKIDLGAVAKNKKTDDVGLSNKYSFDKVYVNADGTTTFVCEEDYTYTVSSTDSKGNTTYRTYYVKGNKLIGKLAVDGTIAWTSIVPSHMEYSVESLGKIAYLKNDNFLYFVYNENESTIDGGFKDIAKGTWKKGKIAGAVVSVNLATGALTRKAAFNVKEDEFWLDPFKYCAIGNDLFIPGGKYSMMGYKTNKIMKVSFTD
jgi:hypothetical protein